MQVSKVKTIVLDLIGVDSILLDPAVPEIKHDLGASLIIIFIVNPDVDNIEDHILVQC